MGHVILIMASGGGGKVWHNEAFPNKLLVPIADEPLIARAARQVEELSGTRPVVLTAWPGVQEVVALYFEPAWHVSYTDTFMSAWTVWNNARRVTVLNGDVVWHPDVLEFVLEDDGPLRIYGDTLGQVYAWAFNESCAGIVAHAAQRMNSYSQVHFFRRLCGCTQLRECEFFGFVPPGTYTRDFDIVKDYENWVVTGLLRNPVDDIRNVPRAAIIECAALAASNIRSIPGWLQPNEAAMLAIYVHGRVALEIGSYMGRSTVAMAPFAEHIYCVDHFHPGNQGQGYNPDSPGVRAEFEANVAPWKHKITVFEMTSQEAAKEDWSPLGLVFVDGGHECETVAHDIAEFEKHLAPEGIMVLHDTEKPGVARALEESVVVRDGWEELKGLGTVRAFVKPQQDIET